MATSNYGKLSEYDSSKEDWQSYIERLELYFTANDIDYVIERLELYFMHNRKLGENISQYMAELRRLSQYCEYGDSLESML